MALTPLDLELEMLALVHDFLRSGPWARAAAALETEVAEHRLLPPAGAGAGPLAPTTLAEMGCPPDQLRRLLRRLRQPAPPQQVSPPQLQPPAQPPSAGTISLLSVQAGASDVTARTAASARPSQLLPRWLCNREMHGTGGRGGRSHLRRAKLPDRASGALLMGQERLGLRGIVEGHTSTAFCLAFDPKGERIFTGADDCLVKVWDSSSLYLLRSLRGHRSEITDLDVHASGKYLASSCNDHTVRVWALHHAGLPCIAVLLPEGAAPSPPLQTAWRALSSNRPLPQLLSVTQSGACARAHAHHPTHRPPPSPPSSHPSSPIPPVASLPAPPLRPVLPSPHLAPLCTHLSAGLISVWTQVVVASPPATACSSTGARHRSSSAIRGAHTQGAPSEGAPGVSAPGGSAVGAAAAGAAAVEAAAVEVAAAGATGAAAGAAGAVTAAPAACPTRGRAAGGMSAFGVNDASSDEDAMGPARKRAAVAAAHDPTAWITEDT